MINGPSIKALRIVAVTCMLYISIGALAAGYGFMNDPTGKGVGIPLDYIAGSPFRDFLIPGIVLFNVNGLLNIAAIVAVLKKIKHYELWIILQGCLLTGWIAIQVWMVNDFNLLHFVCGTTGILLILTGRALNRKIHNSNTDSLHQPALFI